MGLSLLYQLGNWGPGTNQDHSKRQNSLTHVNLTPKPMFFLATLSSALELTLLENWHLAQATETSWVSEAYKTILHGCLSWIVIPWSSYRSIGVKSDPAWEQEKEQKEKTLAPSSSRHKNLLGFCRDLFKVWVYSVIWQELNGALCLLRLFCYLQA